MQTIKNQIILVTGSTDGLGKQVAQDLAAQGATILMHGRHPAKGEAVLQDVRQSTGNPNLTYYNADLASLDAVRQLCEQLQADQTRLDVLINNAGLGPGARQSRREQSTDGHELRFAVNYLAPYLLTYRLLPLLRRSPAARIVNVASIGQQPIEFDNIMLEDGYDGLRAYRQSKLAQIMFTFDLAGELEGSGITVNCLHPATLMNTKMVVETDYFGGGMSTVAQGAQAVVYLATAPELDNVTGQFYDGMRSARANAQAYDREARRQLRALSRQLTGL